MSSLKATPEAAIATENQNFRSQMGRVSRHSAVFFAGTLFTTVAGYLFKVYLARVLGAEALGIYALGMTAVGLVGLFGGLGLTWAASRFPAAYGSVGKFEDLRSFLWWSVVTLAGVNSVLAVLAYRARYWISEFYHTPALAKYVYLFALILFLGAMTTFLGQLLSGYGNVALRTIIANFGGSSLTMLLTVALVSAGAGLWGYIFAQVLSAAVVLCALVWAAWQLTPVPARLSWSRPGPLHTEIFSFAAASLAMDVAGFLSSQTDKVILGFFLTAKSVGVYAVAGAVVAFIPVALQSVNQIFSPTIAELHARGDSALLGRMFQVLTKWILGLTLPLAVVVIVFARPVMRIFGHDFESGWLILVIGTIGQLVNCAVGSVGYLLLMSGNQNRLIRIQLVMAVGMVCLSVLLVPTLGVVGAALAAAATNVSRSLATRVCCIRSLISNI